LTILLMGTGLGELIWMLPTAMHDPSTPRLGAAPSP
jgi:hypothetical protein